MGSRGNRRRVCYGIKRTVSRPPSRPHAPTIDTSFHPAYTRAQDIQDNTSAGTVSSTSGNTTRESIRA
jgi:hypothetical protein